MRTHMHRPTTRNRRRVSAFVALGVLLAATCARLSAAVVLVRDGQPTATLVLAETPRQGAQLAAAEFQCYLEKITGCRLPVVTDAQETAGTRVLIGESRATQALGYTNEGFVAEEYCVRTGDDYLLLTGRDHDSRGEISYDSDGLYPGFQWVHDTGTFYAVLDFLERECGVRWYLPGQIGEVVPQSKTLVVKPVDRRRRPWARHRWAVPRPFPKRLFHYHELGQAEGPLTADQLADWRVVNLWWLHLRVRNEPFSSSHSFGQFHKDFATTHPEYFAEGWPLDKAHYIQPALHKPEVVRQIADMAIGHFDLPREQREDLTSLHLRSAASFSVSPQDNRLWCKSAEAQATFTGPPPKMFWSGWASRYVWDFVNAVARLVGEKHPDKWIACHAYSQFRTPFDGMTIEPNVAVIFCRALTREWHPTIRQDNEQALDAWLKLGPKRLYVYDYLLFPQHRHFNLFPGWIPHWIADDLKRMKRIGVRGTYNDIGCVSVGGRAWKDGKWAPYAWGNPILDQVNFYIWFRFLDDQSRDVDELLDEMVERFYGPAGRHIKRFIDLGERIYCSWPRYQRTLDDISHLDGRTSWTALCPPATLERFGRIMADAHAAAATPLLRQRVQLFDDGVWQMMKRSSASWLRDNPVLSAENSQPLPIAWRVMPDPDEKGKAAQWFAPSLDDTAWKLASTSTHLEKQGIENYTYAWYRTRIDVPESRRGREADLRLGAVDESCWVWVNDTFVGEFLYDPAKDPMSWKKPLLFDVTKTLEAGASNQITVLVRNVSGAGGIWKPSHIVFDGLCD